MAQTSQARFEPPDNPNGPALYRQFWQLWREGMFFEGHEVLEELWRATPGPERWFYNALIHCAVSLHHHRAGNAVGASRQLARAAAKMAPFSPRFWGIETENLLAWVKCEITASLHSLSARERAAVERVRKETQEKVARAFPEGRAVSPPTRTRLPPGGLVIFFTTS